MAKHTLTVNTNSDGSLKVPKNEIISPVSSPTPTKPFTRQTITVKPEYYMLPLRQNAPSYGLVYERPAPKGWHENPAWHRNVFPISGLIVYQQNAYCLKSSTD